MVNVARSITDTALLVGYDANDNCVYSAATTLEDYWDGEHLWDSAAAVKELGLVRVHGYLFNSEGTLVQEFESHFDADSGLYKAGWTRHEDGTLQRDGV